MDGKLVTLIGGGGFLGRYIAQALLAAGARVRIAERDPRRAWFLKPQGGLGQTQFIAADITRPATIARAVDGANAVVNLVGVFRGDLEAVHVKGARTVGRAATEAGATALLHVSALGADVDSPSLYGRTKGEGEAAVREAFAGATIFRPSTVFGREDQFTNRFAGMIASLPVVPVLRAKARFQPVYVADLAAAAVAALADPARHGGKTHAIAGPDVITMCALNRWLAEAIGRKVAFADLPDAIGAGIAMAGFLPGAPISWDQWQMLQRDAVAPDGAPGLIELGVQPTPMAAVAPGWLVRYRRLGRFGRMPAAN